MKRLLWLSVFALSSCAVTSTEGLLVNLTKPTTFDRTLLRRQCDLKDPTACYLLKGRLPTLPRLAILQGVAPADRAVIAVLLRPLAEPRYFLREQGSSSVRALPVTKNYGKESSAWRLQRLELNSLNADQAYELLVTDPDGQLLDVRTFRTLRAAPESFRFAFVHGCDERAAGPAADEAWQSLAERHPQLLLGLGNLVATEGDDPLTPAALWERYAESRDALRLYRLPELIPTAATWGEQDYGAPGTRGGRDNPYTDAAREIQEAFFPAMGDGQTLAEGPGVAKALKLADQTFILMDARSFREGDGIPPACKPPQAACPPTVVSGLDNPTHFGRLEQAWALSALAEAPGPVWLLSSDPWFGGAYPVASFEGSHPAAFADFRQSLEEARKKNAKGKTRGPIFFGSGNPLFTEARPVSPFPKAAAASTEFSVGPIQAAGTRPNFKAPVEKSAARSNDARFLFFTTTMKGNAITVNAEAIEPGNRVGFAFRADGKPPVAGAAKAKPKRRAPRRR